MSQHFLRILISTTFVLALHHLARASTCDAKLKRIADAGVSLSLLNQMARSVKDHSVVVKDRIALIDYSQPSVEKRMYIVNLNDGNVIRYRVSHGIGNDGKGNAVRGNGDIANEFTLPEEVEQGKKLPDEAGSRKVSLGLYQILPKVHLSHRIGANLMLRGLDRVNKLAERRRVLIQRGSFMSDEFVNEHKRAGRSLGSFSVDPMSLDKIIKQVRGSVLYAGLSAKAPAHDGAGPELRGLLRCSGHKQPNTSGSVAK